MKMRVNFLVYIAVLLIWLLGCVVLSHLIEPTEVTLIGAVWGLFMGVVGSILSAWVNYTFFRHE